MSHDHLPGCYLQLGEFIARMQNIKEVKPKPLITEQRNRSQHNKHTQVFQFIRIPMLYKEEKYF